MCSSGHCLCVFATVGLASLTCPTRFSTKALAAGGALALALFAAPVAAYAVNVSSSDGFGYQSASTWYSDGAYMTGKLTSTHGDPVYYQGSVQYNNWPDCKVGRYTSDTRSTSAVTRGGNVIASASCSFDAPYTSGIRVKVCKNNNLSPDSCGPYELDSYP